jgi:Tol biopolymer transport system component
VTSPGTTHPSSSSDAQVVAAIAKRHPGIIGAVALLAFVAVGAAIYTTNVGRSSSPAPTTDANRPFSNFEISQLTSSGNAENPAISPDGKYVVYSQRERSTSSLWIRQVSTSSNVKIVEGEPGVFRFGPTVTRDGSFIDFLQGRSDAFAGPELWRVPFLGGTPKRMIQNVWTPIGWSPDGKQMAFVRVDLAANIEALVVADADGGHERVLTTRGRPKAFITVSFNSTTRPVWSPDGRAIALFGMDGEPPRAQVVFVDTATGVETVRAAQPGFVPQGLAWLDARAVILSQPKEVGWQVQLWRMSHPDGALSPLTNDLNSYNGIDVSADRNNVVTARFETRLSLWVGDATAARGAEVVPLSPVNQTIKALTWAGDKIVYDSAVNGRPVIVAVTPGSGGPLEITSQGTLPGATSDGKTIVYVDGRGPLEARCRGRRAADPTRIGLRVHARGDAGQQERCLPQPAERCAIAVDGATRRR